MVHRDSNMGSDELQIKVKDANRQLIKDKLPTFFNEASRMFYDLGLDLIESKYRLQATAEKNESFANLFTDGMEYQGQELEDMVQLIWDEHLPDGVDVYNLSDQILKDHRKNLISYNGSIKLDGWLSPDDHDKTIEVKNMEERLVGFGEICDMLNSLVILPDWMTILREKISNRLSVSTWKESWDVRMTQIQLKWLHTLVIPWVSFTIPKLENGNPFLSFAIIISNCFIFKHRN
jgi:hypothetical protein